MQGESLVVLPENHVLRHYIVLSEHHAEKKYLGRCFDNTDLSKNWHGNRRNFTKENLALPDTNKHLHNLKKDNTKDFCKTNPSTKHFWEWA